MESVWTAVPTEMLVLSPIFDRSNTPTGRAYSTRRRVYNCCNKAIERWWTRTCPTITHTELMKSVARAGMAGDSMGENTGRGGKRRANQARRKRKGAPQGVLVSYPRAVGRAGISPSSGVRCLVRGSSRHAERSDQRSEGEDVLTSFDAPTHAGQLHALVDQDLVGGFDDARPIGREARVARAVPVLAEKPRGQEP